MVGKKNVIYYNKKAYFLQAAISGKAGSGRLKPLKLLYIKK
jgi:hypothetical protein